MTGACNVFKMMSILTMLFSVTKVLLLWKSLEKTFCNEENLNQGQKIHPRFTYGQNKGATAVVLFSGIMNATRYTTILEKRLLPFIAAKFLPKVKADGTIQLTHRFQQDNDPKHSSRFAQD